MVGIGMKPPTKIPLATRSVEQFLGHLDALGGQATAVFDPVDPGLDRDLDRRQCMRVRSDREPGGMRPIDQELQVVQARIAAPARPMPAVPIPPLAITLTMSTPRSVRSSTAAAISARPAHLTAHVVAVPGRNGQRRTRGQDRRFHRAHLPGALPVTPLQHRKPTVPQVTDRRHAGRQLTSQPLGDHHVEFGCGVPGDPATARSRRCRRPGARGCRSTRAARCRPGGRSPGWPPAGRATQIRRPAIAAVVQQHRDPAVGESLAVEQSAPLGSPACRLCDTPDETDSQRNSRKPGSPGSGT